MIMSGYIVITLLVVMTVLGGSQSSVVKPQNKLSQMTIGQHLGSIMMTKSNNKIASIGNITIGKHIGSAIKYDTDIKVDITCTQGLPGYDCCKKIKDDAIKCIEGKLLVPTEEEIRNMTSDDITKYSCCAITLMTDCILDNARYSCSVDDYKLYKEAIEQGINETNKVACANHKIVPGKIDYCSQTTPTVPTTAIPIPVITGGPIGGNNKQSILTNALYIIASNISVFNKS
ncbi:uncharacterized protein LOC128958249 [Oppia nitens]|uniref:uncharacterized protein LOC128958249 n=1 Tax=Oppia nitens TaxID=1686743 RepID=UPI0023DBCA1B|nr:uncharacterized protein LOC128958249 [Oppia nitens]